MNANDYRVHVCTWNVGGNPAQESFDLRRLVHATFEDGNLPDIVVIGLQEVVELSDVGAYLEVGGSKGSTLIAWTAQLDKALSKLIDEGSTDDSYSQVTSHQLVGLALFIYVRESRIDEVDAIQVTTVGVGMLGLGNKGAVVASLRLNERYDCCFVCSHLAAHQDQVAARNQNFQDIIRFAALKADDDLGMALSEDSESMWSPVAGLIEAATTGMGVNEKKGKVKAILDHHCVIWLGDLNYRLTDKVTEEICMGLIDKGTPSAHKQLLYYDQLCRTREKDEAFNEFEEAHVFFPPSYKYTPGTGALDTRKRMPAWCDRVLWRDSITISKAEKKRNVKVYVPGSPAGSASGSASTTTRNLRRPDGTLLADTTQDAGGKKDAQTEGEAEAEGQDAETGVEKEEVERGPEREADGNEERAIVLDGGGPGIVGKGIAAAAAAANAPMVTVSASGKEGGIEIKPILYGSLPANLFRFLQAETEKYDPSRPAIIKTGAEGEDTEDTPKGVSKVELETGAIEQETLWVSDHLPVFCALSLTMPPMSESPSAGLRRQGLSPMSTPIDQHRVLGSLGHVPTRPVAEESSFFSW
jgi:hypothetical protein